MNNKNIYVSLIVLVAIFLGTWTYIRAEGQQISMCVKKSGFVYVIGQDFRREDCKKNDSLLSWNVVGEQGAKGDKGDAGEIGPIGPQGVKGDVGEQGPIGLTGATSTIPGPVGPQGIQGEQGLPAQHGAGNIAFLYMGGRPMLMKTDGTIWETNLTPGWGGPMYTQIGGMISQLPVPISDIVVWEYNSLIDKNGNYWQYWSNDPAWYNFGPLP